MPESGASDAVIICGNALGNRTERFTEIGVLRVLHHTDDLNQRPGLSWGRLDLKRLANRIAALQELAGEGLVDDCHGCCGQIVADIEGSAGDEWRSECAEELGSYRVEIGQACDAAVDHDVVIPDRAAERCERRGGGEPHARNGADAVEHVSDEDASEFGRHTGGGRLARDGSDGSSWGGWLMLVSAANHESA